VDRFRGVFGDDIPISFSAGVDRYNFADTVALGLTPITVCSDLLKPGGYGRQQSYFAELARRMQVAAANTTEEFVLEAYGHGGTDVSAALLHNTRYYAERVLTDLRYAAAANRIVPKKIGTHLELFDCVTCDKCVPVCPNDANFTFGLPRLEIPVVVLHRRGEGWETEQGAALVFERKHQIGNFADFCNECGNCDVFCPEDGGPYVMKPRFFGSFEAWRATTDRDGFYLTREAGEDRVYGRFDGREFSVVVAGELARYAGSAFAVEFEVSEPEGTVRGEADGPVDLGYFHIMDHLRRALLGDVKLTYINA